MCRRIYELNGPIASALMIRKAIIVLLLIAATATLALGVTSYWRLWQWGSRDRFLEVQGRISYRSPRFFDDDGLAIPFQPGIEQRLDEPLTFHKLNIHCGIVRLGDITYVPRGNPQFDRTVGVGGLLRLTVSGIGLMRNRGVECHFAILLLVLLIYPAIAFVRGPLRRYRRRKRGLCGRCGYNLTGNVTGVCSECGAPIAAPVQAAP